MKRLVNFELPERVEERVLGFEPAYLDTGTMAIYRSRFADGRPARFHILDGLPEEVVWNRSPAGHVTVAKPTLVAGYVRGGFFFTRAAVARASRDWGPQAIPSE